jgi:hypothetical protein
MSIERKGAVRKNFAMKNKGSRFVQTMLLICVLALESFQGVAQTKSSVPPTPQLVKERDGQHDFDWEIGSWKVNISRLQHPLTGSTTWTELNGTVNCRKVWDGRANLAEIKVDGPSGHLEFLALRLYNPQSRQWTNIFASSNTGTLSVPMFGEFKDGRGEFYDQEQFNGRIILVRFIFTPLTPDSGRSEQAFSDDGGRTWETNWLNTYTRIN